MAPRTYMMCIGTRPEIIKMAVLYQLLRARGDRVVLVHTGQHEAVAQVLYEFFGMPPDIVIELKRKSASLSDLTTALIDAFEQVMSQVRPDVVMVQGDTTSALVGALVGYYHDVPVAHIEAGLRTHQHDPFPEEKNRELIGRLAHWHFPPTEQSRANLLAEGLDSQHTYLVGNTVIDAALWTRDRVRACAPTEDPALPAPLQGFLVDHTRQPLLLITAHRRENWGEPIRRIARATGELLEQHPDLVAVWPAHPNPAVRQSIEDELARMDEDVRMRWCLTEPLSYPALIRLLDQCHFTLTDSGGIQEEASAMRKPVLVARESTERQELVDAGGALLVGTDPIRVVTQAHRLLSDPIAYEHMQLPISPFGDGHAAERIADILAASA